MSAGIATGKSAFRIACTLLMVIGFFGWADSCLRSAGTVGQKAIPVNPAITQANYNSTLVCDDAWTKDRDLSQQTIEHFEVKLREGCFGEKITLPNSWNHWSCQHGSTGPQGWIAIWYDATSPQGPWGLDEVGSRTKDWWVGKTVRLQGKGSLIFYKVR
jgi:hypothetical protein